MLLRRLAICVGLVVLALAVLPSVAHAWTPGTHVFLGESVLANLSQLPLAVADLLRAFPYDFLYGNIAADTSIAKKYAPVGRHCHSWHVGREILDRAESNALRCFGLGYLAHLAADSVAHNFYVPRQLVVTSSTIALGHSYWESRFETHLGDTYAREAVDLIRRDHTAADTLLDRVLAPTIFSVRTSRRLFRGMVGLAETQSWQRAFQILADKSRWDLSAQMVESHVSVAYQLIMEVLGDQESLARRLDPAGDASLRLAKRIRLDVMRNRLPRDPMRLSAFASQHFGLPRYDLTLWERSVHQNPWRNGNGKRRSGG